MHASAKRKTAGKLKETDRGWRQDQRTRQQRAKERDMSRFLLKVLLPDGQAKNRYKGQWALRFPTLPCIPRGSTRNRGIENGSTRPPPARVASPPESADAGYPGRRVERHRRRRRYSAPTIVNTGFTGPLLLSRRLVEAPVAQHFEGGRLALILRSHAREPHMRNEIAGVAHHGDHFPHGLCSSDGKNAALLLWRNCLRGRRQKLMTFTCTLGPSIRGSRAHSKKRKSPLVVDGEFCRTSVQVARAARTTHALAWKGARGA
jgi:hypothetical protein